MKIESIIVREVFENGIRNTHEGLKLVRLREPMDFREGAEELSLPYKPEIVPFHNQETAFTVFMDSPLRVSYPVFP